MDIKCPRHPYHAGMASKKPTAPNSRRHTDLTPQERIAVLMDMLDEQRRGGAQGVTIPAWMARLKAETRGDLPSTKTLHRDIKELAATLRDQHDGQDVLAFDARNQTWSLAFSVARADVEVPTCLSLVRTDATVTTLFLAMRAVEQFSHTPLAAPMRAMLDQMAGSLPAPQRRRLERLAGQIHFTGTEFDKLAPEFFEPILAGLDYGRKVGIGYRNLGGGESQRVISPLGLVVVDRAWHVVAVDSKSGEIRDFRLSRIWEAHMLPDTFMPPKGFDLGVYLKDGFGGLGQTSHKPQEVVLRFTQEGAAAALDDVKWHPTQRKTTLPDGGAELRFKTTALFRVEHQVMSYGGCVEILEPRGSRERVKARAQSLAKMHG